MRLADREWGVGIDMKRTLFMVALFLAAVALFAQKKESLAVFAFTGGSASDGEAIASSLTRQAALRNAFNRTTLVTRSTIATMNFEQRFQRNSGLTDADTIFELGKQLNASHVIAGYITKLGDRNLIIVSIMDVESLQQIAGDYRTYRNIEEVSALLPSIAQKLAAAVPRDTSKLQGLSVPPFNIAASVNRNDAMVLAQILACDLANGNKYAVLPRTDSVEAVLAEQQRQREGTTDQERIRRLGAGRNAQFVLSGSVQRLGSLNMFTTDILNIEDGSFADGHEEQYTDFSQGFDLIPKLAMRMLGALNVTVDSGGISITVNSAEAFTRAVYDFNMAASVTYTITLTENISTECTVFSGSGNTQKTIFIQGDSRRRTITNITVNEGYAFFDISKNVKLVLGNNITLNGNKKKSSVVHVDGGIFEMRNGSVISGGTEGGEKLSNGEFIMSGGSINGNSASNSNPNYDDGGGVLVTTGTFTMSGGSISGNIANGDGGGVCVKGGIFNMNGGTISGNSTKVEDGGGVSVISGRFTMSDGAINNNSANGRGGGLWFGSSTTFTMSGGSISNNSANSDGGGVWVGSNAIFTLRNGTIDSNSTNGKGGGVFVFSGTFNKTGGTISRNRRANNGGASVYFSNSNRDRKRESDAEPSVNIDTNRNGRAGGWE